MTDDFPYYELDPGIVDVVRLLREAQFDTCDSGDGITKISAGWEPYECALPYPHVVCRSSEDMMFVDARRMYALLRVVDERWSVQGDYSPADDKYFVTASLHEKADD